MKKIVTILISTLMIFSLVGCSSNKVERNPVLSEDLTKVLDKIYETADLDKEFKAALEHYQTVELNEENVQEYLGDTDVKFTEGISSAPMMSSIPTVPLNGQQTTILPSTAYTILPVCWDTVTKILNTSNSAPRTRTS